MHRDAKPLPVGVSAASATTWKCSRYALSVGLRTALLRRRGNEPDQWCHQAAVDRIEARAARPIVAFTPLPSSCPYSPASTCPQNNEFQVLRCVPIEHAHKSITVAYNFATHCLIVLNQVSRRPKSSGAVRPTLFGLTPTVSIFPQYGDRFRQLSLTHHQIPVTVNSVRYG